LAAIGLAIIATSCGGDETDSGAPGGDTGRVRVVASIYPLEFFTEQVGGDRVQVDGIVPAGGDAHNFEPTPGDLRNIAAADQIVYNGLGFESWVDALLDAGDAPDAAVQASSESIALHFDINEITHDPDHDPGHDDGELEALHFDTNEITPDPDHDPGHDDGELDPHMWLDPLLAVTQVRAITDGLTKIDPEGGSTFSANSDVLIAQLTALDARYTVAFESCAGDTFVTSHDSFNYLAARYDINAVGIAGINPESQPSPRALATLSDAIKDTGIRYVLVSPIESERLSDTLARETGANTLPLHTIQNLTRDQIDAGETYFSLMEFNLESLVTAMDCVR